MEKSCMGVNGESFLEGVTQTLYIGLIYFRSEMQPISAVDHGTRGCCCHAKKTNTSVNCQVLL